MKALKLILILILLTGKSFIYFLNFNCPNFSICFRYGYSLQYFTRKASKGMIPTQVHKILDYAKQNDLQLFDPEEGYVVPGHVYLQNGPKAKKNWSSVPFSIAVWEALSNPTNLKIIEERIKVWNTAADLKLVGMPQGSKVDLAKPVAHFETSDERVQVKKI